MREFVSHFEILHESLVKRIECDFFRTRLPQAVLQPLCVLTPIQVGVDEDLFWLTASEFVEISEVIGMTLGALDVRAAD